MSEPKNEYKELAAEYDIDPEMLIGGLGNQSLPDSLTKEEIELLTKYYNNIAKLDAKLSREAWNDFSARLKRKNDEFGVYD